MAARFRVHGTTNNWSDTTGWALTTGGAGGQAVPTAADDVTFDALSPDDCILDVAVAKLAKTLTCTGYTHTLTFNVTLTVAGNVTLAAGMTFAGTAALIVNTTATFTSAGKTINIPLQLTLANLTLTLADAMTVSGLLTIGSAGGSPTTTINGFSITASGGVTLFQNCAKAGTTTITLAGGTWQMAGGAGFAGSSGWKGGGLTFAGNVTVTGTIAYVNCNVTYTSGTITTTGSLVWFGGDSVVMAMNMAGITWNDVSLQAGNDTYTLSSDWNIGGNLAGANGGSPTSTINGAFNVNLAGNLVTASTASQSIGGTATLVFMGNTTWSNAGPIKINAKIQGNLTISGVVVFNTKTLTYVSGTLATASGGDLRITAAATIDFANGTMPWIFSCLTAGTIITFASAVKFGGAINLTGTAASTVKLVSSAPGTQRAFTVNTGVQMDIGYTDATDMNSTAGQQVLCWKGTRSNTTNWFNLSPIISLGVTTGFSVPFFGG